MMKLSSSLEELVTSVLATDVSGVVDIVQPYVWNVAGRACMAVLAFIGIAYCISQILQPVISYEGKHVVITGGSFGIGLDVAKQYIKQGANITIVARNINKLKDAQKELQALCIDGQKVVIIALDVSSDVDVCAAKLQPAIDQLGDVCVLVNNAGISIAGAFDSTDVKEFSKMFNVNVLGGVNTTRALLDSMKRSARATGGGRIVFVSSQVAQAPVYGYSAYATSKWAVRGLAEVLNMELKPYNIYVSVAYPPDTNTPGYESEMETKPEVTKKISESGSVFSSQEVASDIVTLSTAGYFNISTGLDGWMLRQLHPGMSPVNTLFEVIQPLLFTPLCRAISIIYVYSWDQMAEEEVRKKNENKNLGDKKKK